MCLLYLPFFLSFFLYKDFRQFLLESDLGWWRRTVLESQLPEEQGTLEDVTSARLIFPRHQHQVRVDEDRHLQRPGSPDGIQRRKAGQRPEKVQVSLKASFTFCHPQLFLTSGPLQSVKGFLKSCCRKCECAWKCYFQQLHSKHNTAKHPHHPNFAGTQKERVA